MKINGWKDYNRAAIPITAPHEEVNLKPIEDKSIWKMDGKPFFARWTENFDCKNETEWWYCIKDEPFYFEQIKSKRRTEIRKGLKLNRVEIIKASEYIKEIHKIQSECYNDYPYQYRPEHNYDTVKKSCERWDERHIVFMAFSVETGETTGFACVEPINDYVNFEILKVPTRYKNSQVVAALTYKILLKMLNKDGYKYVCDGARNLVHQTNFMDYLVKQFAFRYAYCDLKMEYRIMLKPIIYILYPFRSIIRKFSDNRLLYNAFAVLKMEEIARNSEGRYNGNV
jgi:hypothetical protein